MVTKTGQSLIKFTKKIPNNFYNKELGDQKDYCIYIDTDSVFYSRHQLFRKDFQVLISKTRTRCQKILSILMKFKHI